MSDINLDWGPGTFAFFLVATAWPGLVLGCALGAILWRAHRGWGGALGALLGFALNVAAFFVWAETGLSTHLDYWDTLLLMLLRGAPGLAVGAAAGAWHWRRRRIAGGIWGALAGMAMWLGGWVLVRGTL